MDAARNTIRLPDESNGQLSLGFRLTGSQAKTAFAIRYNCEKLLRGGSRGKLTTTRYWDEKAGEVREATQYVATEPEFLNCAAFVTLTVGDTVTDGTGEEHFEQVFDAAEASRRANNVRKFLTTIFDRSIIVTERHRNGAVHFHLVGLLRSRTDIRTGFDFDAFHGALKARQKGRRNPRDEIRYALSANPELRRIWEIFREQLPGYGFGRAQVTPIEKTGEAVAAYISKYIEKNICNRLAVDKGKKLVRYLGWEKRQLKPNEFEWNGKRAVAWRGKTREVLSLVGCGLPDAAVSPSNHVQEACDWSLEKIRPKQLDGTEARGLLGSRWAFSVHCLWTTLDDTPVPFMVWEFGTRELCRAELVRLIGVHEARRRDAMKSEFAEPARDWMGRRTQCVYQAGGRN